MNPINRLIRGAKLARRTAGVLRARPSLAVYPLVAALASAASLLLLLAPGAAIAAAADAWWPAIPFAALALYAATYVTIYCNVALAASVQGADGRAVARERRGAIARWALVQASLGVLLNALRYVAGDHPLARIATRLAGGAWAIATFFVVPVLAFEGLGPKPALARSARLVRERWGESLGGSAAIAAAVVLAGALPAAVLAIAAVAVHDAPVRIGLAGLAIALVALAAVAGAALTTIFRAVLYGYATNGRTGAGFSENELAAAL